MDSVELAIKHKGIEFFCSCDFADHELVIQNTWNLHPEGYACTGINGNIFLMHRLILGLVDFNIKTDHHDHNKLNNCWSNLHICSHSQNMMKIQKFQGSSRFNGVYKDLGRYHAQIMEGKRVINLWRYRSEKTAAKVYDREALNFFGEFANPNFPEYIDSQQSIIPGFY